MQQTTNDFLESCFEECYQVFGLTIGHAYFEEHPNAKTVAMSSIHFDKLLQVRRKVEYEQVKHYANAMKNGAKFPPVRLAMIEGKQHLTVIDGWHRLQAAKWLGAEAVPAIVERMTFSDAQGEASLANSLHGIPIKKSELRRAFGLFIKSGRHRKGKGKGLMSYRELSTALHGSVAHTTLANWMKKDFPKIARAMGGIEHGNSNAEMPKEDIQAVYAAQFQEGIEQALTHFKELKCPKARYVAHKEALNLLAVMDSSHMEQPEF